MSRGGAAEDGERGRVGRVGGEEREEGGRERGELAALADHGRGAGDVGVEERLGGVGAGEGEREGRARPVGGRTAPVVVPVALLEERAKSARVRMDETERSVHTIVQSPSCSRGLARARVPPHPPSVPLGSESLCDITTRTSASPFGL